MVRRWTNALLPATFGANVALTVAVALGIWWMVLGLSIDRFRNAVRVTFWPFAEWVGRRHAIAAIAAGATLVAAALIAAFFLRG
jgi:hypothetical protein